MMVECFGKTGVRAVLAASVGLVLSVSAPPAWAQNAGDSATNALHRALHLTPSQEADWRTYQAQSSAPNPAQDRRRAAAQMFPNLTAPQRLDLVAAEMKQELADLQQQAHVLGAFYATLTAEQKSIFDTQTLPPANSQQQQGQ